MATNATKVTFSNFICRWATSSVCFFCVIRAPNLNMNDQPKFFEHRFNFKWRFFDISIFCLNIFATENFMCFFMQFIFIVSLISSVLLFHHTFKALKNCTKFYEAQNFQN